MSDYIYKYGTLKEAYRELKEWSEHEMIMGNRSKASLLFKIAEKMKLLRDYDLTFFGF